MLFGKDGRRLVAALALVVALLLVSSRPNLLHAESGTPVCSPSDADHACVTMGSPGTFTQYFTCTSGDCYTCKYNSDYICEPVGTGLHEHYWTAVEN